MDAALDSNSRYALGDTPQRVLGCTGRAGLASELELSTSGPLGHSGPSWLALKNRTTERRRWSVMVKLNVHATSQPTEVRADDPERDC